MSKDNDTNPEPEVPAFAEYEVAGIGTVIAPEGEPGYRVRTPDGRVIGFAAASGDPCEANAAADIALAIANPDLATFIRGKVNAAQRWMDARAQQDGYDGILSACTYAAPPDNPFAAEGNAYLLWRSSVWATCYTALAAHQPGDPLPSDDEFVAILPAYVPPQS
jgi:hypothetical protein